MHIQRISSTKIFSWLEINLEEGKCYFSLQPNPTGRDLGGRNGKSLHFAGIFGVRSHRVSYSCYSGASSVQPVKSSHPHCQVVRFPFPSSFFQKMVKLLSNGLTGEKKVLIIITFIPTVYTGET